MTQKLHNYLLYLYSFALPFEAWNPFGLEGSLSIPRMIAFLYILLSILNKNYSLNFKYSKKFIWPIGCLFLFMVFSNILSELSLPVQGVIINTSFFQNIILFGLLTNHYQKDTRLGYNSLFAFSLGIILLSILFQFGIGLFYRQDRVSIFGDNPNNQGTKASIGVFLLIFFILKEKILKMGIYRFLMLIPIPGLLLFIAETGSRGAFLTLIIDLALLLYLLKVKHFGLKFLLMISGSIVISLVYTSIMENEVLNNRMLSFINEGNLGGREDIWEASFDIFKISPFWGVGESGFNYQMINSSYGMEKSAHNYFLYVLVTSGIVGLIIFLVYLFRIFKASQSIYKYKKEYVQIILFVSIAFSMFRSGGSLGDKFYWFIFAIIVGSYISLIFKKIEYGNVRKTFKN